MGLSLWIVPNPATAHKLQRVMNIRPPGHDDSTRKTAGKNKSYPSFYPHITLASLPDSLADNFDAVGAALSDNLSDDSDASERVRRPITCTFDVLETGDVYYRSVYVAFALSEARSPGLAALHAQVHKRLNIPVKTPKFAHMSLVYIDEGDDAQGENGEESKAERKRYYDTLVSRKIWKEVDGGSGSQCGLDPNVASDDGDGSVESEPIDHFVAHEAWAVRCVGPVEGWVVLGRWPL